jgi:hypothetical protein
MLNPFFLAINDWSGVKHLYSQPGKAQPSFKIVAKGFLENNKKLIGYRLFALIEWGGRFCYLRKS